MSESWQKIVRTNFTCMEKLADYLQLSSSQREQILTHSHFPLNLPRRLADKMEKGQLDDPILRQFVPLIDEERKEMGFTVNPVGDQEARSAPRLLHKYHGRALVLPTGACAMHCRYCFRRHFEYAEGSREFHKELEILRTNTTLSETILSGGDPLALPDRPLIALLDQLEEIPHLRRIRFHSRYLLGIPERLTDRLLIRLSQMRTQGWFIIHCNHPRELDEEVIEALVRIRNVGIPVLNQAVLLRGVNDNIDTLTELCERLIDMGAHPYYLHQLDRVEGAVHFEVDRTRGKELVEQLSTRLPGYAVPRYVEEIAGHPSKRGITTHSL